MSKGFVPPRVPLSTPAAPARVAAAPVLMPPPPARRRSFRRVAVVAAILLLVGGGVTAFVIVANRIPRPSDEMARTSNAPATTQEYIQMLLDGKLNKTLPGPHDPLPREPLPPSTPQTMEIQKFFDALSDAAAAVGRDAFDRERFEQELTALGRGEGLDATRGRADLETTLRNLQAAVIERTEIAKRHVRLRKVTRLDGPDEVCVVVRTGQGQGGKSRWWLRKSGGTWRWYDYDGLNTGPQITNLIALSMPVAGAEAQSPWIPRARELESVYRSHIAKDASSARKTLTSLARVKFPPRFDAYRHYLDGWTALLDEDQAEAALDAFHRAQETGACSPATYLYLAVASNSLKRYDRVRAYASAYKQEIGEDASAYYEYGHALVALGETYQAASAFRNGLAENPGDPWIRKELARLSPDDAALKMSP